MRPPTFRAFDSQNAQVQDPFRKKYTADVVSVYDKTGRMTAETGDLVQLERINDGIVILLRNGIVVLDSNGYHNKRTACWTG